MNYFIARDPRSVVPQPDHAYVEGAIKEDDSTVCETLPLRAATLSGAPFKPSHLRSCPFCADKVRGVEAPPIKSIVIDEAAQGDEPEEAADQKPSVE